MTSLFTSLCLSLDLSLLISLFTSLCLALFTSLSTSTSPPLVLSLHPLLHPLLSNPNATLPPDTSSGKDILVPLSGSLYVPGKFASADELLVDVGTGYYVGKTVGQTAAFLDKKVRCTAKAKAPPPRQSHAS